MKDSKLIQLFCQLKSSGPVLELTSLCFCRYIYGCVGQEELAAFYRDAAVALVTPLRDGMNLVAKEFVACQINSPPGVLILSPFAGAGEMMHEALICNPYELDDAAEVIHR